MNHADHDAIVQLEDVFQQQKAAYLKDPHPTLAERKELLQAIPGMVLGNAKRLAEALNSDYGYHPELMTYAHDVVSVAGRAQYALNMLEQWAARDYREVEPHIYGSSKAYIEYQPKGVIGNMPAWNFPVELTVGPLCEMLAAGNRAIIKPSEQTPAVGEVLEEIIGATLDRDRVAVVNGGIDLAKHFSAMQWDHLLYTGSTSVGREVMMNAAKNLVPVTLELGGKNPTVFTEEALTPENIRSMVGIKMTKNGQLCINVDHCYVPAASVDRFVNLVKDFVETSVGDYTQAPQICSVINTRQFDRLGSYLDEARQQGTQIIELGSAAQRGDETVPSRMPLTLVINPQKDSLLDRNEVFGPILPIYTYTEFDQVISSIQAGDRPLGIYIFSEQQELVDKLRLNTSSGGFCVNAAALQGAQETMGFGGVGKSGMGRHHGFEGFREFSNPRGCMEMAKDANLDLIMSPHGEMTREFLKQVTGGLLD